MGLLAAHHTYIEICRSHSCILCEPRLPLNGSGLEVPKGLISIFQKTLNTHLVGL